MERDLYGLVLAGGLARRMGSDKSRLSYHGMSQRAWSHQLLSAFCEKVFISVKKKDSEETLPQIADTFDFGSPLNGIMSAMGEFPGKAWLIMSCDMPFVDKHTLAHLVKQRDSQALVSCFLDSDNKNPEPMLGIWEPGCHALLHEFIKMDIRPRRFIMTHSANIIKAPDMKALTNVNTREEYEQAMRQL